jgi:hypothetical protein
MAVFCEFAKILDVNMRNSRFLGAPENAVIERASEKLGKDGDEVEAHGLAQTV